MATLTGPDARLSLARMSLTPVIVTLAAALLAGGCAQLGGSPTTTAALSGEDQKAAAAIADGARPQTELEKATEYWGKIYQKEPRNKVAALSYAKNLKAMGQKQAAFGILQELSVLSGNDREVASEYGRLALEFDQANLAAQALAVADDPAQPDWRVISARGAAAAKLGQYADAVPFFERALSLVPNNPSVINNLAMAYAANGQADRAEDMLRGALEQRPGDERIKQNLTIVLGLKGQHDKAKQVAMTGPGAENATANAVLMQKLVKASAPGQPAAAPTDAATTTGSIETPVAKKSAKAAKAKPAPVTAADASAAPAASGFADTDADALIRKAIASSAGTPPAK